VFEPNTWLSLKMDSDDVKIILDPITVNIKSLQYVETLLAWNIQLQLYARGVLQITFLTLCARGWETGLYTPVSAQM
jgi:hypothetical protein